MEVLPGLHRIESIYNGRWLYQHAICRGGRVVLVDTGISSTPERLIMPYLHKLGRDVRHVDMIVVSHCDADHCGGNRAFKKANPRIAFVAQQKEADLLASADKIVKRRYLEFEDYGLSVPAERQAQIRANLGEGVAMDVVFDRMASLSIPANAPEDRLVLELHHAPGHTAGHLVVHIPELRALIMTDAVLGEAVPDAEGRPVLPPTYRYTEEYVRTVEWIRHLDVDYWFASHFPLLKGKEAIQRFCDQSLAFVEKVESYLLESVERAGVVDLAALVSKAEDRLGNWPVAYNQELAYCLLGGLERLENRGILRRIREGRRCSWEKIQ